MQLFTLRNARLLPFIIVIPYAFFIALLLIPPIQRNAFYANKINPTLWQDLSNVEQFNFHHAQVTPFTFHPADDPSISLYAWHILPLHLYLAHEPKLTTYHNTTTTTLSPSHLITSPAFHLLLTNPSAHLIITFHGNAGHLSSSHRPTTHQHLLSLSTPGHPIHVITFDYRGFGLSIGTPTESGLIADAIALLRLLSDAGISISRITLLGQSLGTAVATGAFDGWTLLHPDLPRPRALILLAGFRSVPSLLESYSVKGWVPPLLSGLDYFPGWVKGWVLRRVVDTWETGRRLEELWVGEGEVDIGIMHARDDWEIPWSEGWGNLQALQDTGFGNFSGGESVDGDGGFEVVEGWAGEGRKRVRWELVRHGGHNRVAVGEQMKALVLRSLERGREKEVLV
jgi:pimeloyl-ACP methyl ester carboxylesterase